MHDCHADFGGFPTAKRCIKNATFKSQIYCYILINIQTSCTFWFSSAGRQSCTCIWNLPCDLITKYLMKFVCPTHENLKWYSSVVSVPCNAFIKGLSRWSLKKHRWRCCDKIYSNIFWHGVETPYNILEYILSQHPHQCFLRLHLDKPLIKALHGTEATLGYHFRFSCVFYLWWRSVIL